MKNIRRPADDLRTRSNRSRPARTKTRGGRRPPGPGWNGGGCVKNSRRPASKLRTRQNSSGMTRRKKKRLCCCNGRARGGHRLKLQRGRL